MQFSRYLDSLSIEKEIEIENDKASGVGSQNYVESEEINRHSTTCCSSICSPAAAAQVVVSQGGLKAPNQNSDRGEDPMQESCNTVQDIISQHMTTKEESTSMIASVALAERSIKRKYSNRRADHLRNPIVKYYFGESEDSAITHF